MKLTDEERDRIGDAMADDQEGCWMGEDCCEKSLDAAIPVIEAIIEERLAQTPSVRPRLA